MGQVLYRCNCLLDFDLLIFFFFGLSWQPLPRQRSFDEVHEHHADLFQVIASCLLDAHVRVKTCIPRRARQLFVVLVADVTTGSRVLIALSQAKIDDVDHMLLLANSDQKVIRFDVAMEEATLMDELDALQHLNGEHED